MRQRCLGFLLFVVLSAFAFPAVSCACLNDRDTLAEEIAGLPDVVQIITGRFERNPPLYYQMRIDRLSKAIPADPSNLANYDDIGVALDRIGRDDEAIGWLEKKRAQLVAQHADETDPAYKELWYRYYANVGTFWAHRWIRRGSNRMNVAELTKARDYIAQALAIKPDAHEGREEYQLMAMDWMLNVDPGDTSADPGGKGQLYLGKSDFRSVSPPSISLADFIHGSSNNRDALTGLSGLVVLGGAWESPDIFAAIGQIAQRKRLIHIHTLADLRVKELLTAGKSSIQRHLKDSADYTTSDYYDNRYPSDVHDYKTLRKEADTWQARRTAYMMVRLTAGRHPDTDPTFWRDWHDDGPPAMKIPLDRRLFLALGRPGGSLGQFDLAVIFLLISGACVAWDARKRGLSKIATSVWAFATVVAFCVATPVWLSTRPERPGKYPMRDCPHCGKSTPSAYIYCRHCDRPMPDIDAPRA